MTNATLLANSTLMYWELSSVWNGRIEEVVATEDAIEWCARMSNTLRPELRVRQCTYKLLQEIIEGTSKPSEKTVILPFARPVKKTRKSISQ